MLRVLGAGSSLSAVDFAAHGHAFRDREGSATLLVGSPANEAHVLGAFQRASEITASPDSVVVRRASGGGAALAGPGSLWLQLSLARADTLVPGCSPDKILNRYVRPLLRILTRFAGSSASYFGRDWISGAHRPVALVGFAHDAASGRALFEAIVAVNHDLVAAGEAPRPTFRGQAPATLSTLAGRPLDLPALATAVVEAYASLASSTEAVSLAPQKNNSAFVDRSAPPWSATVVEAIGTVGAGLDAQGKLRLGGELMASSDAIARIAARIEETAARDPEAIGKIVDEELTGGGAIVFGLRSLGSIRDVLVEALASRE